MATAQQVGVAGDRLRLIVEAAARQRFYARQDRGVTRWSVLTPPISGKGSPRVCWGGRFEEALAKVDELRHWWAQEAYRYATGASNEFPTVPAWVKQGWASQEATP